MFFDNSDNVICPLAIVSCSGGGSGADGDAFFPVRIWCFQSRLAIAARGFLTISGPLVERWEISLIISVPTAISALMQRPVNADISSVKKAIVGSSPLPRDLFKRFQEASGVNILEAYGMTEATCMLSTNPPDWGKENWFGWPGNSLYRNQDHQAKSGWSCRVRH